MASVQGANVLNDTGWHSKVLRFNNTQVCVKAKDGTHISLVVLPKSKIY